MLFVVVAAPLSFFGSLDFASGDRSVRATITKAAQDVFPGLLDSDRGRNRHTGPD